MATTERDPDAIRFACTRILNGDPAHRRRPKAVLERLAQRAGDDVASDHYGAGGFATEFEERVAELLGKEAAALIPTGTMAQQIALRVWADRRAVRTVAFHPKAHLELHEQKAYEHLHGLHARLVGNPEALLTLEDLEGIVEPVAALLLELPQREIGGQLPTWDELEAVVEWARGRDVALHLDGARLWEATPFYARTPAEIAALFDTVYVSFYKGLGGLGGCALAGPADIIAEARVWQARHGGRLFNVYPYALSAELGLAQLERMPEYYAWMLAFADALRGDERIVLRPDPPQSPLVHVNLRAEWEPLQEAVLDLAEEQSVWAFGWRRSTSVPGWTAFELHAGETTLEFEPEEAAAIVAGLLVRADTT